MRATRTTTLDALRRSAASCTACDLYKRATQTVFGEGNPRARIMLVGEQPGHEEDLVGRPFVGPAGRLLDKALAEAGVDRRRTYVTNVVKHFKWKSTEGGKRRIHERPGRGEVEACRPWFERELALVQPAVLVCLGATATAAILGSAVTVGAARGRVMRSPEGIEIVVTVHPSAILRIPDHAERAAEMRRFVADLRRAQRVARLRHASRGSSGRPRR
ncbi:MAG TPA: UdgX family uracil-DNA binding protein [Methylomirabilota bacterium]|nr:UdgX family uracil-DNA binding protein [Methylomirabilota bacterium]